MLQSFEQKAHQFEKHEIQTLKNKKRPFRPFALSNFPDAINYDQRTTDSRGERLARLGLAPKTSKKSPPKGWRAGLVGGLRSNKPSRTSAPKAETPRTKSERGARPAGSAERGGRLANLRANIVPVIRTQVPFRQGRRREVRAERAQRFY